MCVILISDFVVFKNCAFQEKVWLGELTLMTIAVDWDVKPQTKLTEKKVQHTVFHNSFMS